MPVVTLNSGNSKTVDTFYDELNPNSNWQSNTTLSVSVDSSGKRVHSTIFFDLGMIPNDAIINSATLTLQKQSGSGGTLSIHKATSDWITSIGLASWNNRPTFESTPEASLVTTATNSQYTVDVKNLVQRWVNGETNYGFYLKMQNEAVYNQISSYGSFDNATPANRPTLTIDYTIPTTGKKCVEYVGNGGHVTTSSVTSFSMPIPPTAQAGDLLVAQFFINSTSPTVTPPSGWTIKASGNAGSYKHFIVTKTMSAGEMAPVFTSSASVVWAGVMHVFRNVKSILGVQSNYPSSTTSFFPPALSVGVDDSAYALLNLTNNGATLTPPLSYGEVAEITTGGQTYEVSLRYMYQNRSQSTSEMTSTASISATGSSVVVALEPITNNEPMITLTSPTDNQVLTEGNELDVEGSATEADNNNNVLIKCQINNGPIRNIGSGVSDGSTPISFARTLTYSNKRIWEGSTDVTGADLAENTNHTLKVWAEDDQGGKSADVIRTFTVVHNRPPVISGANEDLGTLLTPPSKTYSVTELEGDSFTVTEKVNGTVIRSFPGIAGQEYTVTIPHDRWIRLDLDTPHALTVEATDSNGLTSTRTYSFTRTETHIEFMLDFDNPDVVAHFTPDGMPERILVTLERYLPPGSDIESVKVCNNALDAIPTWEDATTAVRGNRGYLFTNTSKTAMQWRIDIWVVIAKGTATERVLLNGYGGAFD